MSIRTSAEVGPRASILVPVYRSEETLRAFLEALERQTVQDFETIAVDSSPGDACMRILASFPRVRAIRSAGRLWPHQARTRGVAESRAPWLVFTDPDVVPAPDWLERMLATAEAGDPVVGALGCVGDRWLDRSVHLCKFSKWLPGRPATEVDMGPTANVAVARADFETVEGFGSERLLGDVELSRRLRGLGRTLRFASRAVVDHHHTHSLGSFLKERFVRGIDAGRYRSAHESGARQWALLVASFLPVRWVSNLVHCARHAAEAGWMTSYVLGFPVVALGFAGSILGEALGLVLGPAREAGETATAGCAAP
jgi:GT2 family glycosyltransferase